MRARIFLILLIVGALLVSTTAFALAQDAGDEGSAPDTGEEAAEPSEDESGDWKQGFLIEDETEQVPEAVQPDTSGSSDTVKRTIELLDQFDVREVMARKREGAEATVSLQSPGFGRVDPFLIPATIPDDLRSLVLTDDLTDLARTADEIYAAQMTQLAGQIPIVIRGVIDNGAQASVEFDVIGVGRGRAAEGSGTNVGRISIGASIVTKDYVQLSIQIAPGGAVSRSFSRGNSDFGGSLGRIRNQGQGGGRGGGGRGGGGRGGGGGGRG